MDADKRKKEKTIRTVSAAAAFVLAISVYSCQTEQRNFTAAGRDGVYLFEAETFRLVDSEIVDDPAASGGKAVRIMSARAFCSIDIQLPPGTYVARVKARAEDGDHDEFFLSVGKAVARVAPERFGRYGFCPQVLEFQVDAPGKDFLQFAAFSVLAPKGETGMTVDYLEVWERSRWEKGTTDNTDKN